MRLRICGLRSSRSYFRKIPQSKEKLEKFQFERDVKIKFLICLGRCWIIFLNSIRRIKWGNLFFQDFSYIWNNLSPFFYIPVLKYYLLLKDSVFIFSIYFFQFFFTLWFFRLILKIPVFYKIPVVATRIVCRTQGGMIGPKSDICVFCFFV